ncbi:hypothetical protein Tco_0775279 [Tanacetum coccineum]
MCVCESYDFECTNLTSTPLQEFYLYYLGGIALTWVLSTYHRSIVPPKARLKNGECNRRIKFSKLQREATYQVTLDALKLSPCYPAFLITAGVPKLYMHQFWNTVTKVKESSSYQFKLYNKKFRVNAEVFRDILQICPKLTDKPFDIPPSTDEEIISL